jgi:hypothetical protein
VSYIPQLTRKALARAKGLLFWLAAFAQQIFGGLWDRERHWVALARNGGGVAQDKSSGPQATKCPSKLAHGHDARLSGPFYFLVRGGLFHNPDMCKTGEAPPAIPRPAELGWAGRRRRHA